MKQQNTPQNNIPLPKKTKRTSPAIDPNCFYSFKMIPISQVMVDKWVDEVLEYAAVSINKTISGFYRSKGLRNDTYYKLLGRHPELKASHEEAMRMMGERLWGRAVDKDADWAAVKHRLHNYAPEFDEDNKYHNRLKAEADAQVSPTGNKEYILEKVIEYRDKPDQRESTQAIAKDPTQMGVNE
jgi:hypothetical protein